jgi:hypothetical protein
VQDQGVLSVGLLALFLTFAHDRIASTRLFNWHADTEPYGLFVLICYLGYAATRRVLANEGCSFQWAKRRERLPEFKAQSCHTQALKWGPALIRILVV